MRFILLVFFVCIGFLNASLSQESVNDFLMIRVNKLRDSLNIPKLRPDAILDQAAKSQANYIAGKKKLGHEQNTPKLETVADRVFNFGGNRTYIGENVAEIGDKFKTNKEIADQFFEAWKNSPPHYINMINPNFTRMGFGYKGIPNRIFAAQVFSSEEISLPKQFNNEHPNWGIKPNAQICKMLKDSYETMTFANNVQVVDYEVFFFFHDMPFFESVISDNKDGLAIDVVLRDQFPCNRENQLHISPVFDGQMQKPVYKKELFKNNISGNPNKMYVKIGEIPSNMRNLEWDVNVIVIKNNFNCDYCVPSFVSSRLYPLLKLEAHWDEFEKKNYFDLHKAILVRDTFDLSFHFSRSNDQFEHYESDEMQRMMSMLPYVKSILVDCFASVEGSESINKELLKKRKTTLSKFLTEQNGIASGKIAWNLTENWTLMNKQIERYQIDELKGKSNSAVKEYLKENQSIFFDSLLFEQRASRIRAYVDTVIVVKDLETLIKYAQYDESLNWQDYEWSDLLEAANKQTFVSIDYEGLNSILKSKKLLSNFLATAVNNNNIFQSIDSVMVVKYLSINNINCSNHRLVFNYANFLTHYWYRNFRSSYSIMGLAPTITPVELLDLVNTLNESPNIKSAELEKLKFNVYLAGVLYYTAYSKWDLKEKFFDEIVNQVVKQSFSVQDAEQLLLFFNYFHKFERSVKLLEPYFDKNELSENGQFWLAETATMIRQKLGSEQYAQIMDAAKNRNHARYCSWVNDYFQIQRDEYVKQDFCKSCKSKKSRRN